MHRTRPTIAAIASTVMMALCLVLAGCGSDRSSEAVEPTTTVSQPVSNGTLTVSTSPSLAAAMADIATRFRQSHPAITEVNIDVRTTTVMATELRSGTEMDVYASPDELKMATLASEGLFDGDPHPFASNEMAMVVAKDSGATAMSVSGLADVARVALCDEVTSCGGFTSRILAYSNTTIPEDHIERYPDSRSALSAVSNGEADAAIVYLTDVLKAPEGLELIRIAETENVTVSYSIAVVAASHNKGAAEEFLSFVLSEESQELLQSMGFKAAE